MLWRPTIGKKEKQGDFRMVIVYNARGITFYEGDGSDEDTKWGKMANNK